MSSQFIEGIIPFSLTIDSKSSFGFNVYNNRGLRKLVIEYFKLDKTKSYTIKLKKNPKYLIWNVRIFDRKKRYRPWKSGPWTLVGKMPLRKDLEVIHFEQSSAIFDKMVLEDPKY